jgi:predicted O-methyltransferase YrrM
MRNLPEVGLSFDPLTRILNGAIRAKLLLTAIELEAFSHLGAPMSAERLARELGTHPENTRVFLDALAANDLLHKQNGRYANTPLAGAFLVKGEPTYVGDALLADAEWMQPALHSMAALVKHGPTAANRPRQSVPPAKEAEVYANCQRAGVAQRVAAMVSQLPEFSRMKKMLDLGAGAGLIGIAIVAAHPTMTGVLFDRPAIIQVAQRFIREYELQDRVTTIGGDYSTDPIGDGYDLVWTRYTLSRDNLDLVVRRIHAALNPGGVYFSYAEGLTHEHTRPVMLINGMLAFSLTDAYTMFDEGEIAQAMLRAGFKSVHSGVVERSEPYGPAVIDVARK